MCQRQLMIFVRACTPLTPPPPLAAFWRWVGLVGCPQYVDGESVIVWVNTVGPMNNPQESYPYYDRLPFCTPDKVEGAKKRPSGLGEILAGNELRNSGMDIKFKGKGRGYMIGCTCLPVDVAFVFRL